MRILIRTSKWAIWARRFGSFAVPVIVISVWMHRSQALASETFLSVIGLAAILAVLALISGIVAYVRLWQSGDRGWGRATVGIFLGLLCLSPLAYGASLALRYPLTNDVSTDTARPLQLVVKSSDASSRQLSGEEISSAFPDVYTRTYQTGTQEVFERVASLIEARQWQVRVRKAPGSASPEGQFNIIASTLLGFRDEIVVRLSPVGEGSIVDMRSTSLVGEHDLGRNGTRIEAFLRDLDQVIADETPIMTDSPETH